MHILMCKAKIWYQRDQGHKVSKNYEMVVEETNMDELKLKMGNGVIILIDL
jgi:hypothetical protein